MRGSGKWLIRSVDVRVQVDRAGLKSRPAVPSRARAIVFDGSALRVLDQLAVDRVRDPSLEAADRLERLLAFGSLASVVGAAVGVESDLADRGDVDHVVHPPVPSA